jgi:DNA invertase Pin-like site-specific DNA recombinase
MKIAIYARVSTKDKGQEVENQIRQLEEFCKQRGWTITDRYVDHETGSKSDRAEFLRMFGDASRRKFEMLLFWSLDRLTREGALETLQHLNRLTKYDVGFKSFTEEYLDSCGMFRDAVISILATIAKQERQRISERTKAGMERARANGSRLGRPCHRWDRDLIAKLRSQGSSCREISTLMGIPLGTLHRELKSLSQKGCELP